MHYTEASEHTTGRLHALFANPYQAFDNQNSERLLHIHVMLHLLALLPLQRGQLVIRVIHGWQNGGCDPYELRHTDVSLSSLEDLQPIIMAFEAASRDLTPFPGESAALLGAPLGTAIEAARGDGQMIDANIHDHPSRWPEFNGGLTLYTLFKMYHRLVYGEDEPYRSSRCMTELGQREIHEFHLEEGEFAFLSPPGIEADTQRTLVVLHHSQLAPFERLLGDGMALFEQT